MNDVKDWVLIILTGLGLDIAAMKAGMMGGFMSLTYERKRTVWQAATSIVAGAVMAGYLGPLAAQIFQLQGGTYAAGCFILGLLAMRLVPWIFLAAEHRAKALIKPTPKPTKKKTDADERDGNNS